MQITRQTKLIAIGGGALLLVVIVLKLVVLKSPAPVTAPPPVVHHDPVPAAVHHTTPAKRQTAKKHVAAKAKAKAPKKHHAVTKAKKKAPPAFPMFKIDATLPPALRVALTRHRVVVAVLFAPGVASDAKAVATARKGAKGAHAGFALLNVRDEHVARSIALKLHGSVDPSVLVVTRPGTIALVLSPWAGADAVAQAAGSAK